MRKKNIKDRTEYIVEQQAIPSGVVAAIFWPPTGKYYVKVQRSNGNMELRERYLHEKTAVKAVRRIARWAQELAVSV